MANIPPNIERQLAEMTDAEFSALTARVRAPDTMEQFRDIAKTIVPEHVLNDFIEFANPVAFVDENGRLDEARVRANLHVVFGHQQSGYRQWGQHASAPPGARAGDAGREEARRRAGRGVMSPGGTEVPWNGPAGWAGRAEAARRRHGTSEEGHNG